MTEYLALDLRMLGVGHGADWVHVQRLADRQGPSAWTTVRLCRVVPAVVDLSRCRSTHRQERVLDRSSSF